MLAILVNLKRKAQESLKQDEFNDTTDENEDKENQGNDTRER